MEKSEQMALRFTHRAEKLRAIAEKVKDPQSREAMLNWARDYDRLAERAIELGPYSTRPAAPPMRHHDNSDQLGSDAT